jgi:hypothetical protein
MNNSKMISGATMAGPQTPYGQQQSPENRQTLFSRLENIASLSQIVRAFGACAIIASMSLFMLQGWAEGNDISRYLKLLAQTGLLTAAGLVLSFLIKEFKGARVFFGLALISVVANFTILGSLSYSMFAMDMQMVNYPESMKWEITQGALFLPVFLGALTLLSAVAYFAFSVFSRQIAKPLTIGFLGLSALLLVPLRAPLIAVGLAAVALWGALLLIRRLSKAGSLERSTAGSNSRALLMTKETKASLAVLLLPGLIILARAVSFYNIDDATLLAFSSLLFFVVRSLSGLVAANSLLKRLVEIFQLVIAGFIAIMTTQVLPLAWNSIDLFIAASIFLGFAFEQLRSDSDNQWKALVVNLAICAVVPIALINASLEYGLIYSIQALFVCGFGLALTLSAGTSIDKTLFSRTIAMLGIVIATLIVLFDLVQLAQLGNWMIIGFSGAILIIAASLYERFGLKLLTA